jgi:hypothetical protein
MSRAKDMSYWSRLEYQVSIASGIKLEVRGG